MVNYFSTDADFGVLKSSLPYIRAFKDKIFLIKLGGELCEDKSVLDNILEQLVILINLGIKIVLVHGGGNHATTLADKLGVKSEFVSGRRITSEQMLDIAKMSFAGQINTDLVAGLKKFQIKAVGLSAIDAGMLEVTKRKPQKVLDDKLGKERTVDFGFVADIKSVNTDLISSLINNNLVPVICSIASDENGQVLNLNADSLASALASSLKVAKLCLLGTVDGVLQDIKDPQSLLSILRIKDVEELLKGKSIAGGMIPKLTNSVQAIKDGVPQVHLISGVRPDAILQEILTSEGSGTMILP